MKWRVGFFLLWSFLFACHSKYDNSNLSIFKYNESNGISTLDPAFSNDKATIWATSQIFSPLVKSNMPGGFINSKMFPTLLNLNHQKVQLWDTVLE